MGHLLGDIFTTSSGHPAFMARYAVANQEQKGAWTTTAFEVQEQTHDWIHSVTSRLPDLSWYNVPKIVKKPNDYKISHKIYRMVVKYSK
jgi:hypothetical protein